MKVLIEKNTFEVGILDDKPHFLPKPDEIKNYAGGPSRKNSRKQSSLTTAEIFVDNMERSNIDFLRRPFKDKSSDIIKFSNLYLKYAFKKPGVSKKRIENLLQAIVRNPILRQEYGGNSSKTSKKKGFNRFLIDTAQMFKAIRARMIKSV
jgi:hypothetical protein